VDRRSSAAWFTRARRWQRDDPYQHRRRSGVRVRRSGMALPVPARSGRPAVRHVAPARVNVAITPAATGPAMAKSCAARPATRSAMASACRPAPASRAMRDRPSVSFRREGPRSCCASRARGRSSNASKEHSASHLPKGMTFAK
jgi:hypothetical protein